MLWRPLVAPPPHVLIIPITMWSHAMIDLFSLAASHPAVHAHIFVRMCYPRSCCCPDLPPHMLWHSSVFAPDAMHKRVPSLAQTKSFLDVGGGSGAFAIVLCRKVPDAKATVPRALLAIISVDPCCSLQILSRLSCSHELATAAGCDCAK